MSDYDLERLTAGGRRVVHRPEAPTTQDIAFTLAEHGAPDGTVALTGRQTMGRGRQGRAWVSPEGGGIWFSMVMRPPAEPETRPPMLVAATAVAVAEALEAETGVRALVRWPNDLLVGGRKVAGILLETRDYDPRAPLLVLGIGVNTAQTGEEFPEEIRDEATSVLLLTGEAPDRTTLLEAILASVEKWCGRLASGEESAVEAAFVARAAYIGERVTLFEGNEKREGVLESMSPVEGFVLREDGGVRRKVKASHAVGVRCLTQVRSPR